jgi:hypothetical protein
MPTSDAKLIFVGPVAQQAKAEGVKTRDEFADLANSRQIPEQKTATGQNLTREQSCWITLGWCS